MSDSNAQPNSGKPYIVEFLGTSGVNGMHMETWEVVHAPSDIVQCAVFFRPDHAEDGGGFQTRSKLADRIAACLNACDGINPEAVPELFSALEDLVRINEEHNEAVGAVVGKPPNWKDSYLDRARVALSKAKGGVA